MKGRKIIWVLTAIHVAVILPTAASTAQDVSLGDRVRVTAITRTAPLIGIVRNLTTDTLSLGAGARTYTIPLKDVRVLEVSQGRVRDTGKGALIGTGAGALAGGAIFFLTNDSTEERDDDACGIDYDSFCFDFDLAPKFTFVSSAVIGGLAGAFIGAIVGVNMEHWHPVTARIDVALAPRWEGGTIGMRVNL